MKFTAEFELEDEEELVKTIYRSVKEELHDGTDTKRSFVHLALKGKSLYVTMGSDDVIRLRAMANTWLRLVKIADEMVHVVKECGTHGF